MKSPKKSVTSNECTLGKENMTGAGCFSGGIPLVPAD